MRYNNVVTRIKVKNLTGFDKTRGLIGAKKAYPVFFQTHFGIHTFGLNFPIDVLILDRNNKIVKIVERLKPNRLFFWDLRFNNVVELPEKEIKKQGIKLKDIIKLTII